MGRSEGQLRAGWQVVADAIELLANAPDQIADSGEAVAKQIKTSKEMLRSLRRVPMEPK